MRTTNTRLMLLLLLIAASCVTQFAQSRKKKTLSFYPAVVVLKGRLTVKTDWGPPNFGENPKTDSKEPEWILVLDRPINVRGNTGPEQSPSDYLSVENVREMELVLAGRHNQLKEKKVVVKGTLFHAHTGHHHTDVLLDVQSIKLLRKTSKNHGKIVNGAK